MATGLTTPRIRVQLCPHEGAVPGVDDPVQHETRALNADMVAFDRERARAKWPSADVAPMLWVTYLAWRAGLREGFAQGMTLAQFEAAAWQVEILDESTQDDVDPTQPGHGPG